MVQKAKATKDAEQGDKLKIQKDNSKRRRESKKKARQMKRDLVSVVDVDEVDIEKETHGTEDAEQQGETTSTPPDNRSRNLDAINIVDEKMDTTESTTPREEGNDDSMDKADTVVLNGKQEIEDQRPTSLGKGRKHGSHSTTIQKTHKPSNSVRMFYTTDYYSMDTFPYCRIAYALSYSKDLAHEIIKGLMMNYPFHIPKDSYELHEIRREGPSAVSFANMDDGDAFAYLEHTATCDEEKKHLFWLNSFRPAPEDALDTMYHLVRAKDTKEAKDLLIQSIPALQAKPDVLNHESLYCLTGNELPAGGFMCNPDIIQHM